MLRRVRTKQAVRINWTSRCRRYQLVCKYFVIIRQIENEIQNNEGEIAIAQKQVGGFHCLQNVVTADPKQIA